jgi:hypothetical protein
MAPMTPATARLIPLEDESEEEVLAVELELELELQIPVEFPQTWHHWDWEVIANFLVESTNWVHGISVADCPKRG